MQQLVYLWVGFDVQHIAGEDAAIKALQERVAPLQCAGVDVLQRAVAASPVDLRLAQVVDCRFFGGLSDQEIATAMGVTPRTVQRDWLKARMLLRRAMAP